MYRILAAGTFVVVYEIKRRKNRCEVLVSDPAIGLLKYDEEDFKKGLGSQYGIVPKMTRMSLLESELKY